MKKAVFKVNFETILKRIKKRLNRKHWKRKNVLVF